MPAGLVPWFRVPGRRSAGTTVIFGHWAAMGFRMESDLIALDSGCVWGNALTGVRLEDRRVFHVPCPAD
jgi:bis(5'-nucleosyl)-tetraphosphatase (symmetrical)